MKVSSTWLAAVFLALVLAFSACGSSGGGGGDDGGTGGNGNGANIVGTWYTDPDNTIMHGMGFKFTFQNDGALLAQGAFCNDPYPCYMWQNATWVIDSGKLVMSGTGDGITRTMTADYDLNDDVLTLTNITYDPPFPAGWALENMTLLLEGSFNWHTITPATGTLTIDGQNTGGNETDGLTEIDDTADGINTNNAGIEKVYFALSADGNVLYAQAVIVGGYDPGTSYIIYFDRNGDYGCSDENESIHVSNDEVMNTKWLVGGPDDTGSNHAISTVPGCAAVSVIEFEIDLQKLGNPTSLMMNFTTESVENVVVDNISTVIVNLGGNGGFTTADLQGTWYTHSIGAGDAPGQFLFWSHMKSSFDDSGNSTCLAHLNNSGSTDCSTRNFSGYSVSSDGTVTIPAVWPDFSGTMNAAKNQVAFTYTDGGGAYSLGIMIKMEGTSFSTSDLQGTWMLKFVAAGDAPDWLGWGYAKTEFDGTGNYNCLSSLDSDGNPTCPGWGICSVSADGIITGANIPSLHGIMSSDKNTFVATMNSGGELDFIVGARMNGITFSTADLEGTWIAHGVLSGDSGYSGWSRLKFQVDAAGTLSCLEWTRTWSAAGCSDFNPVTLTVANDGIVSKVGDPSWHGIMSLGKNRIVTTETDGSGYGLGVITKF